MRLTRFYVSISLLVAMLVILPACGNAASPSVTDEASAGLTPVSARPAGRVIRVADGDTVTLLTPNQQQQRVRLAEIDTPERNQAWGGKARRALADRVHGKDIRVVVHDIDRYGRVVGTIYLGDTDINAEMVRLGHAWVYRHYLKRPELLALEDEARRARRGLWALPESERMPPWQWRRQQREQLP